MEKEQVRTELRLMARLNKSLDLLAQEKKKSEIWAVLATDLGEYQELYKTAANKYQELIDRTIDDLHNLIEKYKGAIETCLSPDEKAIAIAVFVEGKKIFEVASALYISDSTVDRTITEIVRKISIYLS